MVHSFSQSMKQTLKSLLLISQEELYVHICIRNTRFHFNYGRPGNGSTTYISNPIIIHILRIRGSRLRRYLILLVLTQQNDKFHETLPVISLILTQQRQTNELILRNAALPVQLVLIPHKIDVQQNMEIGLQNLRKLQIHVLLITSPLFNYLCFSHQT